MNLKAMNLALATIMILGVPPTQAEDSNRTGMKLLGQCTVAIRVAADFDAASEQDVLEGIRCLDYIGGFVDGLHFAVIAGKHERTICVPDNAQTAQLARVFVKFADQNPTVLHGGAAAIVGVALLKAFPCKKGS